MSKLHETNNEFYLDILEEEEERIINRLSENLNGKDKYLFFRYVAVRDIIQEIKIV